MLKRVLVANRGEIAVRIIRACREMNIETVAVYSTADAEALHTKMATQAVCVGPAESAESYLNIQNIITAAIRTNCDAIHPGFGFLSENPDFAAIVVESGLKFIGPCASVIEKMGNKAAARELMIKAGVPVVPGSDGVLESFDEARKTAEKIGYPVLIKASAGGGGRGMRAALDESELKNAFDAAKAEARACFANDEVYMEKLIVNPKHIEFQILADTHGNIIHLGERECSIQRKNQKMVEETPSKSINEELRARMGRVAVNAARGCGYTNAGTVEFVVDSAGEFYFIEMNTRIQVEHPVTEMATGVDIVKEQLRIAAGLPLANKQEDISFRCHAIECRINAEDPVNGFMPCPGKVDFLQLPGGCGVRVDSSLFSGCTISPYYDSMVAKVIVSGKTRLEAIYKMRRALEEFLIDGVKTNQSLLYLIMHKKQFVTGRYDTGFIEKYHDDLLTKDAMKTSIS